MILLAASRPGGYDCLYPLFQALRAAEVPCRMVVTGVARSIAEGHDVEHAAIEAWSDSDREDLLRAVNPTLVVSTLVGGAQEGLDRALTRVAKSLGLRTLGVLDSWTFLADRLHSAPEVEDFACVPDLLAVMDEPTRNQLLALGVTASQLVVTGQPAFDERLIHEPTLRERLLSQLGCSTSSPLYVFFSEPLRELPEFGLPFDQHDALSMFTAGLSSPCTVLLKRHPVLEGLRTVIGKPPVELLDAPADWSAKQLLRAADGFAGVSSTLLVKAYLADFPLVVCHPSAPDTFSDPCVLTREGYLVAARSASEVALRLGEKQVRTPLPGVGIATATIVDLITRPHGFFRAPSGTTAHTEQV